MKPHLALYAPTYQGNDLVLRADLTFGPDKLSLMGQVSPQTRAWLKAYAEKKGKQAYGWLADAARRASQYVSFEGDWHSLIPVGPLAEMFSRAVAMHNVWSEPADLVAALGVIRGLKEGSAQGMAQCRMAYDRICADACQGNPLAIEAMRLCDAAMTASAILDSGRCYDLLTELGWLTKGGDEDAALVLAACRLVGQADTPEHLIVRYDLGDAACDPLLPDSIAGFASDALAFRAIAPRYSITETHARLNTILGQTRRW